MNRRSLFLTLFYTFTPVSLIGIIVVVLVINQSVKDLYIKEKENEIESQIDVIYFLLENHQSFNREIQSFISEIGLISGIRITLTDSIGSVLGDSKSNPEFMDNHLNRPEISSSLKNGIGKSIRFSSTLSKELLYLAKTYRMHKKTLVIRGALELSLINDIIFSAQNNVIYLAIFVSGLLLIFSYYASKRISKPLVQMRIAAEKYVKTFKIQKAILPKSYTKEIAFLAKSFNLMAKEINSKIETITKEKDEKESVLSSIQEGLIVLNRDKEILSLNDVGKKYLNIESENYVGKTFKSQIKDKKTVSLLSKILKSKKSMVQKELRIKIDKPKYFLITGTPLIVKGEKTGSLITINDLTLVKKLEKVRQDFVSNVSHELKTPITSIAGFVEVLKSGTASKEEEKLFIDKVLKQTNRMNDIIDDLLKLSRIEFQEEGDSIMLVKTPAISIIDGAIDDVRSFLEKENKQIEVKCDPKLNIRVDALLIREAINNLLHNAIKYGDQTSNINIFVNVKENIQIVVENRGKIIPKKYRKRIFERFFRVDKSRSRSAGGTGLGLSIVKHILFVHNGSVDYSSLQDDLNRFTLKIPF